MMLGPDGKVSDIRQYSLWATVFEHHQPASKLRKRLNKPPADGHTAYPNKHYQRLGRDRSRVTFAESRPTGECSSPSWELMAGRTSCRAPADDPEVDTISRGIKLGWPSHWISVSFALPPPRTTAKWHFNQSIIYANSGFGPEQPGHRASETCRLCPKVRTGGASSLEGKSGPMTGLDTSTAQASGLKTSFHWVGGQLAKRFSPH
ncbi:hypothetical protein M747DRAFT_319436 [Aspergillus niger ATCC 13496]|uniref:Uncharacterized protein n=3 Tax=Aspergillus niger TaxID=5061 RepID=A2R6K3_ASPNC|nr:hypothetical protein An16g00310 [Aspergillus niger]RDH14555.1 hypothetical protein M747DRAFT_319436 [Aspergillus niger ATCC 13496]CAK42711.1 hypothetical protein An16g00310 [Aspergillus niger]